MSLARGAALPLLAVATVAAAFGSFASDEKGQEPGVCAETPPVVAVIGDCRITDAEITNLAGDRLARLRSEEYQIKRRVLEDLITKTLLEKEAAKRGMRVEELARVEVETKVLPITEEQKRAVYDSNRAAYADKDEAEALAQIGSNLKKVRIAETRRKLLDELRQSYGVQVLLDPPRVRMDYAKGTGKGAETAPVTVVEFSDFQCPYCAKVASTLSRVEERYKGRVRVVFRNFPLSNHKQATRAAEAAQCAKEQGKFWEMHDRLFENQSALEGGMDVLKTLASDLQLDTRNFVDCLNSGRHAAAWQTDVVDGRRYGVTGTPTFFVNGRMMVGAQSFESLADVVEEELALVTQATAPQRKTPNDSRRR